MNLQQLNLRNKLTSEYNSYAPKLFQLTKEIKGYKLYINSLLNLYNDSKSNPKFKEVNVGILNKIKLTLPKLKIIQSQIKSIQHQIQLSKRDLVMLKAY